MQVSPYSHANHLHQSFVTRYKPIIHENGLVRHVDGAQVATGVCSYPCLDFDNDYPKKAEQFDIVNGINFVSYNYRACV